MFTKYCLAFALAVLLPTAVLADDVDDAAAICEKHVTRFPAQVDAPTMVAGRPRINLSTLPARVVPKNDDGANWDHCVRILGISDDRERQKRNADEAQNPELKKTRDMARKLDQQK